MSQDQLASDLLERSGHHTTGAASFQPLASYMRFGVWRSERWRGRRASSKPAARRRRTRFRSIVCISRAQRGAGLGELGRLERASAISVSDSVSTGLRPERLVSFAARASAAATSVSLLVRVAPRAAGGRGRSRSGRGGARRGGRAARRSRSRRRGRGARRSAAGRGTSPRRARSAAAPRPRSRVSSSSVWSESSVEASA